MAEQEKNEEKGAEEAAPKKKLSGLSLFLIGQMALMAVCVGLVAKGVFMMKKPDLRPQVLKEKAITSIRDEEAKVEVYNLDEFVVNISQRYILKTKIQVEVSDGQIIEKITARKPAIRARILGVLSNQNAQDTGRIQAKLLLKDAIRDAINEELFEIQNNRKAEDEIRSPAAHAPASAVGVVRDVYLVDFVLSRG